MAAPMNKAEYLKKYLSENGEEKQKKKRKRAPNIQAKISRSRIVDDDIDLKSLLPSNLSNTLEEDVGDNDPTIAEMIDERPEHVKQLEKYRSTGQWKVLGQAEDSESSKRQRHDSDSDQSPQRGTRHDSDTDQSPPRQQSHVTKSKDKHTSSKRSHKKYKQIVSEKHRHDSDSDSSLHRNEKHNSDYPPPGRLRHDSDSDQSPVRKSRHDSDSDQSPVRKSRHDSDSDQSPVRKSRHDSDSDQSPVRKSRHDSDSDQSPVRKSRFNPDSDQSPVRRGENDSDSDQSPVRRNRHDSDPDQSPPRKRDKNTDSKQSKKFKGHGSHSQSSPHRKKVIDSDESPPRRKQHNSDSDQSPPKTSKSKSVSVDRSSVRSGGSGKDQKTLGGKKAGLSSARDMRLEAEELKRKVDARFKSISDDRLGKGAATVFRDKKSGKIRDLEEEKRRDREEERKKEKDDEQFKQWGKGLKQVQDKADTFQDHLHEMSKPLARYQDDEDLDQMLRKEERIEDPMLAFIKKKKKKSTAAVPEKPKYRGPPRPPNRFGILPGYRWDGVDRSNGFEKQIFAKQSERKAFEKQRYKWSTEDM